MNRDSYSPDWTTPTTVLERFGDAMELLCQGERPPDVMLSAWLDHSSEDLQEWASDNGPAWAQGIGLIDAAMVAVNNPTEILFVDHPNRPDHEHYDASRYNS